MSEKVPYIHAILADIIVHGDPKQLSSASDWHDAVVQCLSDKSPKLGLLDIASATQNAFKIRDSISETDVSLALDRMAKQNYINKISDRYTPSYYIVLNDIAGKVQREQLIQPGSKFSKLETLGYDWIKLAIMNIQDNVRYDQENPEEVDLAPASDRLVSRSDNTPEYDQSIQSLEKIIFDVSANNEFSNEFPEEKDAVVADLKAGKEILNSDSFWLKSIWETLIKALKYLSDKFGDAAIGAAASELLQLLLPLLGIG